MGTKHFAEKVKEKSGIDEEKEELLGVDNIFKVVDLERELKIKNIQLEEERKLRKEEQKLRKEEQKLRKEEQKLRK
ncbi:MAG: hypothetical protein ACOC44_17770, partial [Promethearchaeia archaeon]